MKKYLGIMILLSLITLPVLGASPYVSYEPVNPYGNSAPTLHGAVFMVPAGVALPATTTTELNSQTMLLGQSVTLMLSQDFYYGEKLVAPAGSTVNGTVIQLKKANFAGINGALQIKFTSIVTPFGQMIPISGQIKTNDGTGVLRGGTAKETTKEYVKDVGVGAAGGAISGLVFSAISGGSVGKGTAIGTAIGGGVGLGKSVIDKGGEVSVPSNTNLLIQLEQPITINSAATFRY